MMCIDVFHGDADGICALHQLRLHAPREARLVSGVKRDTVLLARVAETRGATITVVDISLDRNRTHLLRLLEQENTVLYVDHHFSGEVPQHPGLTVHLDPDPRTCASLIVDALVGKRYGAWAVVGAFGDNQDEAARRRAAELGLSEEEIERLRETGILLNYNGYGEQVTDLLFPPEEVYRAVQGHEDPLVFHDSSLLVDRLRQGYEEDLARARTIQPLFEDSGCRVFRLPGKAWARRVCGVLANILARQETDRAHALLVPNRDGTLRVSVRAPLERRTGADSLCRQFPTGGGRAAAAGINHLPATETDAFITACRRQFAA